MEGRVHDALLFRVVISIHGLDNTVARNEVINDNPCRGDVTRGQIPLVILIGVALLGDAISVVVQLRSTK